VASQTERAWAAGFFDGEGHVRVDRSRWTGKYVTPVVTIGQKTPELLQRFKRAVGVGRVTGPYLYSYQRVIWHYKVSTTERVRTVSKTLWFKLGKTKKKQFIVVLGKIRGE